LWREVMTEAHRGHESKPLAGGRGGGFWSRLFGGFSFSRGSSTEERERASERERAPFRPRAD
jgi:hypothetical protein